MRCARCALTGDSTQTTPLPAVFVCCDMDLLKLQKRKEKREERERERRKEEEKRREEREGRGGKKERVVCIIVCIIL